ncbi:hypothetical protein PMAYCL1PPCAC_10541, partial [Pristionchus mayeri]
TLRESLWSTATTLVSLVTLYFIIAILDEFIENFLIYLNTVVLLNEFTLPSLLVLNISRVVFLLKLMVVNLLQALRPRNLQVRFSYVYIFLFERWQGLRFAPSAGEITLGMVDRHHDEEISLEMREEEMK